jgi:hypothetical protein
MISAIKVLGSGFRVLGSKVPFFALQATQGKQGSKFLVSGLYQVSGIRCSNSEFGKTK